MKPVSRVGLGIVGVWALWGLCAVGSYARQGRPPAVTPPAILAIEDDRAPTRADLDVLLAAMRSQDGESAARALGRLQRRDVITDLLPHLSVNNTRAATATAVALSLRGSALGGVPAGQQERAVLDALIAAGESQLTAVNPGDLTAIAQAIGHVPYVDAPAFKAAESFLRKVLEKPFPKLKDAPHAGAARGLEALARLNRKLATLDEETIERLRFVARTTNPRRANQQRNALAALVAAQGVDPDTLEVVLAAADAEVRRLAVLALTGSGSAIEDEARLAYVRKAFSDRSTIVRVEAVRAWTRRGVKTHGCQPLLDALTDQSLHIVLAALDALGDACRDDDVITIRMASEARTPPPQGRWHREAHAFVALAKRDRERAAIGLLTFATHTVWQVRMYAARAAAILDDAAVLARLAADPDNNVAEAALVPLRRLTGAASDSVFVEALHRRTRTSLKSAPVRPYQIIRSAALALDGAESTPEIVNALVGALERITAERCETSRDTRLALIARLAQLGSKAQVPVLAPLLKDLDPQIAAAAGTVISQWTGTVPDVDSPLTRSSVAPAVVALSGGVRVSFEMDSGRRFDVELDAIGTALTRTRFLAAVRVGYYDNLTFHRVVPNFVIQGGSPGANEYCGDCPFMRDEVGGMHERGTIGISTRGPDTSDAQIFINLVDNPRLDYDYTVFARVCSGMNVVDEIQEGDRIARVHVLPPTETCGG